MSSPSPQLQLLEVLSDHIDLISIHDIGAIGGLKDGPLQILQSIKNSRYLAYEADPKSEYFTPRDWFSKLQLSNRINIPFLAGSSERIVRFNITKDSRCSSILYPDSNTISLYQGNADRFQIVEHQWLPMTTIDTISGLFNDSPSVIKVDAQGYDLQVLEGANNTIKTHRPYIIVEMNTLNYYQSQASFGSISSYLESLGYHLARFYPANHYFLTSGKGPHIVNFVDGLWVPNHSLDLPRELLLKELILEVAFSLCFSQKTFKMLSHLNLNNLSPLIQMFANSVADASFRYSDHSA